MTKKNKKIQKIISIILGIAMLFQPFYGVTVLAEGETVLDQAIAGENQTVLVDNQNQAQIENNVQASANTGQNTINTELTPTPTPTLTLEPETTLIDTPTPTLTLTPTPESSPTELVETAIITPTPTLEPDNVASVSASQITTISNDNQAGATNTINTLSQTGTNQATDSSAIINTGNAVSQVDAVNVVNTNLVGENFWSAVINSFGTSDNDINLTQIEGYQNIDSALISILAKNSMTADGSVNLALANFLSSFAVFNTNSAELTNNINLQASTGNNQISGNQVEIQTGNANAVLNLVNMVNTNIIGKNWFFGIINIFKELKGDIVLPYELSYLMGDSSNNSHVSAINQNQGQGSLNTTQAVFSDTTQVVNNNQAVLTNNLLVSANTGNNEIIGSGNIQIGDANTSVNVNNIVNTNIIGSNWLFLMINNVKNWTGNLFGWWGNTYTVDGTTYAWIKLPEFGGQSQAVVSAGNTNTGDGSENQATAGISNNLTVNNYNTANVENNLSVGANSGENTISGNSAAIQTGNANASVNVLNMVNTNIIGNNWYFGVINLFDRFVGDVIFPRPDLRVNKSADKQTANPGEEISYVIQYTNQGKLWAENVILTDNLPSDVTFVSASNNGVFINGKVVWDLGKIPAGGQGSVSLILKVNSDFPEEKTLTNSVSIKTITDETNKENNYSQASTVIKKNNSEISNNNSSASNGISSPIIAVCNDTPPEETPKLLSAITETNSVKLTWSEAVGPVSYYLVAYGTEPGNYQYGDPNVGGKGTTSITINHLAFGIAYYFAVKAVNGCAPGAFSNEIAVTTGIGSLTGILGANSVLAASNDNLSAPSESSLPVGQIEGASILVNYWWLLLIPAVMAAIGLRSRFGFLKRR